MILNHKAAIDLLVEEAGHVGFNRHTILNLHALPVLTAHEAGGMVRP